MPLYPPYPACGAGDTSPRAAPQSGQRYPQQTGRLHVTGAVPSEAVTSSPPLPVRSPTACGRAASPSPCRRTSRCGPCSRAPGPPASRGRAGPPAPRTPTRSTARSSRCCVTCATFSAACASRWARSTEGARRRRPVPSPVSGVEIGRAPAGRAEPAEPAAVARCSSLRST